MSKRTEKQTWRQVIRRIDGVERLVALYIGNRSKYMPHQGKREMARRLAKAA